MTDGSLFHSTGVKAARITKRLRLHSVKNGERDDPLTVLSWQAKKANDLWTKAEWTSICQHLHNENPSRHFVMGFRDESSGEKKYVRSKGLNVDRAISWSWASVSGKPKSKLAFVPYSTNERQQSRWGGMDFDSHNGESGRARELAFAAFRCFLNMPELCVILETSGSGGWHVWAISQDFHNTGEWVRLLKKVASLIGVPIVAGVCEIFPPDSLPSRFGRGMRAPGTWNPGTDTYSEIVWENTRSSLGSVLSGNWKTPELNHSDLQTEFPDTEKETSFSFSLYRESEFLNRFGITAPKTRNGKLSALVGEVFHQVGRATGLALAQAQFRGKAVSTNADESEHMASFENLWRGLSERFVASLSEAERRAFTELTTENERDAFRIIRSYARKADKDGAPDFPIVRDNLATRLGITGKGAAKIRDKLATMRVIERTAHYQPNKTAARFKWLPVIEKGDTASPKVSYVSCAEKGIHI